MSYLLHISSSEHSTSNECFFSPLIRFKSSHLKKKAKFAEERVSSEAFGLARSVANHPPQSQQPSSGTPGKSVWDRQRFIMEQHNTSANNTGSNLADGILLIKDYNVVPMVEMSIDPLTYWKGKKEEGLLPKMIPVVKKFLCVPATSVPSEQLFSKAGELIPARRNRLGKKMINILLFLNKNL